jgi:hypothetical protein
MFFAVALRQQLLVPSPRFDRLTSAVLCLLGVCPVQSSEHNAYQKELVNQPHAIYAQDHEQLTSSKRRKYRDDGEKKNKLANQNWSLKAATAKMLTIPCPSHAKTFTLDPFFPVPISF